MEADPIFPIASDPVAMLEARSELRAFQREFQKLQPRKLKMIARWMEGYTFKEIGKEHGLHGGTVGSHIHHSFWRLRRSQPDHYIHCVYGPEVEYKPEQYHQSKLVGENGYSTGRIVRNGVEVWPPWPKRK